MNCSSLQTTVRQLENTWDVPAQLKLLQQLNDLLLTRFCLPLSPEITLLPLWVEAYYYHPGKFEDESAHRTDQQKNRFGKLYIHTKGWGGADLCLSQGDYCLSCLLKYTLAAGELRSQLGLKKLLSELCRSDPELKDRFLLAPLPEGDWEKGPVYHSPRKGLTAGAFRQARLASLKGVGEYPFRYEAGFGQRRLLGEEGSYLEREF